MRIYLSRFLNVPAARLPEPHSMEDNPNVLLHELPMLLNRQQQVNKAGNFQLAITSAFAY
ncbi:hypothetical protein [Scytonema sp. NUACC21]